MTNLAQQLSGISHKPPFQVLLDMQDAYNYLDMVWCMDILREYWMG